MIDTEERARHWLRELPSYDAEREGKLDAFSQMLVLENARQNLVAQASLPQLWRRHIADSAQLMCHVPRETATWLDLGTGAGFPGLIVAVLSPEVQVTLVESRTKRASWLSACIEALGIANARVRHGDVKALSAARFDVISARAFAPLDRLFALAARFSTGDTTWVLPKGRSAREELAELRGWRHTFHVEQSLTEPAAGIITGHLLGPEGQRG